MPLTRVPRLAIAVGYVLILVGCSQIRTPVDAPPDVREDRTITFDSSGRAAFPHGRNGVFVTDPNTGEPKRIYEPTPDDNAVGPLVWEPGGERAVFTVAQPLDGTRPEPLGDAPADGRRYSAIPIRYTCWLHDLDHKRAAAIPLFKTTAGHAGYVAAGLAVCWHPDGKRLDFVERADAQHHRVCTFDTSTGQTAAVPLPAAENVALGSDPSRSARYAAPQSDARTGAWGGLWVEGPRGEWWRVPASEPRSAYLEELRVSNSPCWSRDGTKLAFTDGTKLCVCDTTTRTTETWFRSEQKSTSAFEAQQMTAVYWHPDGTRLGVLDLSRLGLVDSTGWRKTLTDAPVISFAGWDAIGDRLAYVTREPLPHSTWSAVGDALSPERARAEQRCAWPMRMGRTNRCSSPGRAPRSRTGHRVNRGSPSG